MPDGSLSPRLFRQAETSAWRELFHRWLTRIEERQQMQAMDWRERQDARLSGYDIARECAKPFWQA